MLTANRVTYTFLKKKLIGPGNQVTGPVLFLSFQDSALDSVITDSKISKPVPDPVQPGPGVDPAGSNQVWVLTRVLDFFAQPYIRATNLKKNVFAENWHSQTMSPRTTVPLP